MGLARRRELIVFLLAAAAAVLLACGRGAKPPEKAPSPVTLRAALGQGLVKAGEATSLLARVDLEALSRRTAKRPTVNLALVVDTSGSMDGRAIDDARRASLALIESLSAGDRLAFVTFDSTPELVLPSTELADADLTAVRARIAGIRARGTTDLEGGLRMALAQVRAHFVREGVNRVVLLGDGVPNAASDVRRISDEAGQAGVSITTLGLGDDYDETLMGDIAQRSGGRFHYVQDSTRVAAFFREEVVRLNRVVARQATLELMPGPGVHVTRVIGQPSSPTGRGGVMVQLGDVSLGDARELVVELAAEGARAGRAMEVVDAILRYREVGAEVEREERAFLGAKVTSDADKVSASRDESVEKAAARAREAALVLEDIRRQREEDKDKRDEDRPAPAPLTAAPAPLTAAPAPVTAAPELASPTPPRPVRDPRPAVRRPAPAELRRMHDDAMKVLQGRSGP
ncbi:MAG: VWA domain-containing protein [Myxococcales bacterium]|nr:VWA domain-containing protein [Myxococcales bacterium]